MAAGMAVAGTASYRGVVLSDSPVVYYELDETSGATAVNSATTGATYTGTFNTDGGPVTVNQESFAQGGTCYEFGGGFIGAASALTSSLDEWTVEAWVNYDSAKTSASNFLSNDQGGWNNDVLFGIGAEAGAQGVPGSNVGLIHHGSPGTTRDFVGAPLAAGEWHHVIVTGSTVAGALTLYIDGVLAGTPDASLVNGITFNGADGIGTANLTIGAARPNSVDAGYRPYDGLLDEVAIYDKVLGEGTIADHYAVGTGAAPTIFNITAISYSADTDQVTLTWDKTGAAAYAARLSSDMVADWDADLDDSISVDRDENPEDAEHITVTFTLEESLKNEPRLFIRIEEAP